MAKIGWFHRWTRAVKGGSEFEKYKNRGGVAA